MPSMVVDKSVMIIAIVCILNCDILILPSFLLVFIV